MKKSGGETELTGEDNIGETLYVLKLVSLTDPKKTWTFAIEDELLIGRGENCALRLEDRSVSREQCMVSVEGKKLALANLGATNKTAVNGHTAYESFPLSAGDTITFGREALKVEYINIPGNPPERPTDPLSEAGRQKTALLF